MTADQALKELHSDLTWRAKNTTLPQFQITKLNAAIQTLSKALNEKQSRTELVSELRQSNQSYDFHNFMPRTVIKLALKSRQDSILSGIEFDLFLIECKRIRDELTDQVEAIQFYYELNQLTTDAKHKTMQSLRACNMYPTLEPYFDQVLKGKLPDLQAAFIELMYRLEAEL